MMQKRTLYSLLLTSFILVCAFSFSVAQEVTFESKTVLRCEAGVLNIDVLNPSDISAFEIVFEVSSGSDGAYFSEMTLNWDPNLTVLTNRVVDTSGVDHVSPDTIRIAGMMTDPGDNCLVGPGPTTVVRLNFVTNNVCSGTIVLDGAVFTCPNNPLVVAQTQFVDCATTALVPVAVNAGTVTIQNVSPTLDPIATNANVHWGDPYNGQAMAHDLDLPNGCENLTFTKLAGSPAAMAVTKVTDTTASIVWNTTGADICEHTVEIEVADSCGAADTVSFVICVYNIPPIITCPNDTNIIWGDTVVEVLDTVVYTATDPDGGPGALLFEIASFTNLDGLPDPPNMPTITSDSGEIEWITDYSNDYTGTWELCVKVSDGADTCAGCSPANADTCCFIIEVIPKIHVYIEKTEKTPQGTQEWVSIHLDSTIQPPNKMGGFDFLIWYDASALTFQFAEPGSLLEACGWEYFTYRYGVNGNCGAGACPTGIVRIVAMAEINNGSANHPSCWSGTLGELARLNFFVTNDRTFECQYVPIKFIWYDCGDNAISSKDGDTLFVSQHVYDYGGGPQNPGMQGLYGTYLNITDMNWPDGFPTYTGAQAECLVDPDGDGPKLPPLQLVNFFNGGIDIVCVAELDDRGDINLNGQKNEIADAVMFTNYFIYGLSVFHLNQPGQIAATDVNADGLTLSVADLVYQIRVIIGDALPYPKLSPVVTTYTVDRGVISVEGKMGAAYVVVEGDVTPSLLADQMDLKYNYDTEQNVTRVLVYSLEGNGFSGEFLNAGGTVVSLELGSYEGAVVKATNIPADFALNQNYPNPFNPTTTIGFALPTASDYTLTMYNVSGQEVARFSGRHEAGVVELEWNAANYASGIYFYKLNAGSFSATKKMVLLK